MSAPVPIDLVGFQGATLVVNFTFTRKNSQGQTVPVDLSGATIWMTVKYRYTDPDPGIVQASTGNGGFVVTDAPGGLGTAMVDNTVFASMNAPINLVYDTKVKESSGVESISHFGQLTIKASVTQAA